MRTLAILAAAAALAGCHPNLSPEGVTVESLGYAQPDPTLSCFAIDPDPLGPQPLIDRWNGKRGYVFWHHLGHYCHAEDSQDYGVVGVDPTLTEVIFVTEVADMNGVAFYRGLPGTIRCYTCDVGQVGTQNTDTGGNHQCNDSFCIPNAEMAAMQKSCPCVPRTAAQACGDASCGFVADGCGGSVDCGGCRAGQACVFGSCACTSTRPCPKGSYHDPDSCACVKGLPQ